jgi:hypothetical protein
VVETVSELLALLEDAELEGWLSWWVGAMLVRGEKVFERVAPLGDA